MLKLSLLASAAPVSGATMTPKLLARIAPEDEPYLSSNRGARSTRAPPDGRNTASGSMMTTRETSRPLSWTRSSPTRRSRTSSAFP